MSKNLKLDSNHDIIIGRGATRVAGTPMVAQLVKCRLLALLGEWKLDPKIGLPWFDSIFTRNVRTSDIESAVANVIRATNGVRQLVSLSIDANRKTRVLTISFEAVSVYGDISEFVEWRQFNTV